MNIKNKFLSVLMFTAMAGSALTPRAAAQGEDVAAVVNPSNPTSNIS